jgi:hypothetical protein
MKSKLPTDPLADASTGVRRRSRGAFFKNRPAPRPERRDPSRQSRYTGPERRQADSSPEKEEPAHIFGLPRWIVVSALVYLAALALTIVWIFTF